MSTFGSAATGSINLTGSDVWKDGVKAYFAGRLQHQNPHNRATVDGQDWKDGWRFARAFDFAMDIYLAKEK